MLQRKTIFILIAVLVSAACNPTSKLGENQYLLNKNKIVIDNSSVSKDDLKALEKQKPNRKILGLFRFHLWLYNLVDKEKTERKKAEWVQKTEKKNVKRRAEGKSEIDTDKLIFREKLLNIGEEPAILDTFLTERTKKQFSLYLFRKGFFNAEVSDSIVLKKNHKAEVTYTIHCGHPYTLRNITYSSKDTVLNTLVNNDKENSLLHAGDKYDEDIIDRERERITSDFKDKGYFFFNKNYITFFDSDSSLNSYQVDIPLYINRINENVKQASVLEPENHHPYYLNDIYIQTDYNLKEPNSAPKDTVSYNDYYFLSNSTAEQFRKEPLLRAIFLKNGNLFQQSELEHTYSRLLDLGVFKFIKVVFSEVPRNNSNSGYLLNVFIQLSPSPKQDYSIEAEATNTGGNLGLAGSFGYRNKNVFKGSESLEFRLKGAVEALRNFNDSGVVKKLFFFNTFEIGPEVNMNLKRLFPFPQKRFSKSSVGRTNLSASFNYQERPDYTRRITNGSFAWTFHKPVEMHTISIYWADVNSVKVELSQEFNNKLNQLSDLSLRNSYSTHLTPASRITYVLSNQLFRPNRNFFFFKANFESAGYLASYISDKLGEPRNADGRKTILRVPYAQYIKPDFDFSYHKVLDLHNMLVLRMAIGYGIEGRNSSALPFEKSFFGGGANSLRAWQARTLGPGSYKNEINIEQSGDMKFESNIELRSSIFKILEGAAFVDAGNIWTHHADNARPGSQFNAINFFDEMAIGAGIGLRFNFSFFILRLDGAVKIHDPALDLSDRWVYTKQKFQFKDITPNLAIGYPF